MKLVNPLYYPVPIAIAAVTLVLGVRVVRVPSLIAIPGAAAIAFAGATYRRQQLPQPLGCRGRAPGCRYREAGVVA
ncbi:MAG: hypothetical protein AAFY15_07375, partial [Cyanobacteria bacterium J06648_11]